MVENKTCRLLLVDEQSYTSLRPVTFYQWQWEVFAIFLFISWLQNLRPVIVILNIIMYMYLKINVYRPWEIPFSSVGYWLLLIWECQSFFFLELPTCIHGQSQDARTYYIFRLFFTIYCVSLIHSTRNNIID